MCSFVLASLNCLTAMLSNTPRTVAKYGSELQNKQSEQ